MKNSDGSLSPESAKHLVLGFGTITLDRDGPPHHNGMEVREKGLTLVQKDSPNRLIAKHRIAYDIIKHSGQGGTVLPYRLRCNVVLMESCPHGQEWYFDLGDPSNPSQTWHIFAHEIDRKGARHRASGLRIVGDSGCKVTLYDHDHFDGDHITLFHREDERCQALHHLSHRVDSMRVELEGESSFIFDRSDGTIYSPGFGPAKVEANGDIFWAWPHASRRITGTPLTHDAISLLNHAPFKSSALLEHLFKFTVDSSPIEWKGTVKVEEDGTLTCAPPTSCTEHRLPYRYRSGRKVRQSYTELSNTRNVIVEMKVLFKSQPAYSKVRRPISKSADLFKSLTCSKVTRLVRLGSHKCRLDGAG